jgi:hypothetical protein
MQGVRVCNEHCRSRIVLGSTCYSSMFTIADVGPLPQYNLAIGCPVRTAFFHQYLTIVQYLLPLLPNTWHCLVQTAVVPQYLAIVQYSPPLPQYLAIVQDSPPLPQYLAIVQYSPLLPQYLTDVWYSPPLFPLPGQAANQG